MIILIMLSVVNQHILLTIKLLHNQLLQAGIYYLKSRRSKLELYLDVLKVIKEGTTKPTRIMHGANLSWKQLQGVLGSMVYQGLLEEIDVSESRDKRTNTVYMVTSKGESVIRYFDHAEKLIEVDESDFNPLQFAKTR
jgi:predicted transcriptional regulator